MRRLLPPNLDIDQHLQAKPPAFAKFHRDKLVELLHLLLTIPATNRRLAERLDPVLGYVPLSSALLRQWLPDYNYYLNYAVESGLLETDNHFIVPSDEGTGKCRGYRFAAPFRHGNIGDAPNLSQAGRVTQFQDSAFAQRLERGRDKKYLSRLSKEIKREYGHLLGLLDKFTPLRIHAEEALAFISQERNKLLANPELRKLKRRVSPEENLVRVDPNEQYEQQHTSILKLLEGDMHYSVDQKAGRLHTTLTNMSSQLREFVYAEGQGQLVAIDLRNSQPYLANLLLTTTFYKPFRKGRRGSRTPISLEREGGWAGERVRAVRKTDPHIILSNILQSADNKEVDKFRSWTGSGQFYTEVQYALNTAGAQAPVERDDVKVMMFEVLFSRNSTKSAAKEAFAKLFPTVSKIFQEFKVKDHTILACLLQALEAHLFLRVITKRIYQKRPDILLFTVHDSIVTPIEHVDYVEKIMRQELTNLVGIEPQFTRSFWGGAPK